MAVIEVGDVVRIGRREAPALAEEQYRRMATLAAELSDDDWHRPTPDCPLWTVRDVFAHIAGSMAGTSLREGMRQRKLASQRAQSSGGAFLDEMNQLHIEERADLSRDELIRELHDRVAPAVRARRRLPGPLRRAPIPGPEGLRLSDVVDVILTRDVWMHRIDVCRATDREPQLTQEHDGRIVADVVREWADKHGQPFTLRLSGEAGGVYASGDGGPQLELDAVEFCRILSGRGTGDGLLKTTVVF